MHNKILYALIAKGTFVLAEYESRPDEWNNVKNNSIHSNNTSLNPVSRTSYNSGDTNDLLSISRVDVCRNEITPPSSPHEDFASMARKLLGRVQRSPGMHSYVYGSYMFTYVVRFDLLLMCITNSTVGHDIPNCFLNELLTRPELLRTGEASVLTRVLRDMLEYKSDCQSSTGLFGTAAQLAEAEEKLDSVASVVKDNLRKVVNRSENIDSLLCKASDLSTEAFSFRDSSRQLHRRLWCANLRSRITILSSVAICALLVCFVLFFLFFFEL